MTISLGIESTAHTFSVGIVSSKGKILADERSMYQSKTGIIPVKAAQHHENVCHKIIQNALQRAKAKPDMITFSRGPGLPPCLRVGLKAAKEYSKLLNIPYKGINHCIAHLTIGNLLTKLSNPVYVYVSGANTQIIAFEGKKYRIFGETLDIGLGNALDKFGRIINLGFPAGPIIEQLAKKGKYIEAPYAVKGMDVSFSGIVTFLENLYNKKYKTNESSIRGAKNLKFLSKEDLCNSFQETAFAMLTEVTERAIAHTNKKQVILIGGVGANKRLIKMLNTMCKQRKVKFKSVPIKYAGDNGVMIAWQGLQEQTNIQELRPYERTDDVSF